MYPDRRLIGRQIERTLQSEPNVNVMFIYGKKKKKSINNKCKVNINNV